MRIEVRFEALVWKLKKKSRAVILGNQEEVHVEVYDARKEMNNEYELRTRIKHSDKCDLDSASEDEKDSFRRIFD